ncbi:flagellar motor switch protein FliM [Lysobacter korlensis]|uniref:Flagellar motor switch protein FliM n=1 Tax=Lysobacter korlensis TaxID=553636 RepID=A0ABV6RV98_9GAMM
MTVQERLREPTLRPSEPDVEVYDFRRPTTLAREQSRVLELAFETFARQWGTQLTAKVRVVSRVHLDQVLMQSYDQYASSLPSTTAMVLCTLEGVAARAVIQFPTSAALSWVGRMLGGAGTVPAPDRKFTGLEQAIIRQLIMDALEDLRYSLGSLLTADLAVESIHYNSQFAQAAATNDLMIVAKFGVTVGPAATTATVAFPADVLMAELGQKYRDPGLSNPAELIRNQVHSVPVDVALRLKPAPISPRAVLDLAVGDLLTLPHPHYKPLDIAVGDHIIGSAAVGANGSRLACVVVDTQEAS